MNVNIFGIWNVPDERGYTTKGRKLGITPGGFRHGHLNRRGHWCCKEADGMKARRVLSGLRMLAILGECLRIELEWEAKAAERPRRQVTVWALGSFYTVDAACGDRSLAVKLLSAYLEEGDPDNLAVLNDWLLDRLGYGFGESSGEPVGRCAELLWGGSVRAMAFRVIGK